MKATAIFLLALATWGAFCLPVRPRSVFAAAPPARGPEDITAHRDSSSLPDSSSLSPLTTSSTATSPDTASPGTMSPGATPPGPVRIDESSPEVKVFRLLNSGAANGIFDRIMPLVTDFNRSKIVLTLIWAALVLFGRAKGRWVALMLIPLITATDQISASLIKPLVGRLRPCEVLGNVHLWSGPEGWIVTPGEIVRSYKSSFSFPSSHATNITAAMLFLGLAYRKLIVPLLLVAFTVSYSRIYIGVHWPLDVAGGMALGALLAGAAWWLFQKLYRPAPTLSEPDKPPSE
ncbi:MAG: phosphatase PAP2 family protein [Candidatus Krumholzibacteriota bacterium]|nr:phosphatase PAP2 family protein [Candidatus Krumholzibacteriota bacterium]